MSTWASSHKNLEIREAEEESLQHSKQVARDHYQQNKQNNPQNLVQTYVREENIFPNKFVEGLDSIKDSLEIKIKEKQELRLQKTIDKLKSDKATYNKSLIQNRPLSASRRVYSVDADEFIHLVEYISMKSMEKLVRLKPRDFRDNILRIVMGTEGENGEKMRALWIKIYRGDLRYGIRDARIEAEGKGWPFKKPQPMGKDRNSWILFYLKKACIPLINMGKVKNSEGTLKNVCPAAN